MTDCNSLQVEAFPESVEIANYNSRQVKTFGQQGFSTLFPEFKTPLLTYFSPGWVLLASRTAEALIKGAHTPEPPTHQISSAPRPRRGGA